MWENNHPQPHMTRGGPAYWKWESCIPLRAVNSTCNICRKLSSHSKSFSCSSSCVCLTEKRLATAWAREGKWTCRLVWKQQNAVFPRVCWLRTRCPKRRQVKRSFLVPSSQRRKEQLCWLGLQFTKPGGHLHVQTLLPRSLSLCQLGVTEASEAREDKGLSRYVDRDTAYISQSRLLRSHRLCKEKERQPRKLSNLHRGYMLFCSYTSSQVPGKPEARYICFD